MESQGLTSQTRLIHLGWTEDRIEDARNYTEQGLEVGRIVLEHRHRCTVATAQDDLEAEVAGRLLHQADDTQGLPVVGDWVAIQRTDTGAMVHAVLQRGPTLSRHAAGRRTREQVVAANLDTVFLVMGLDGDFNLRRLERLLVTAWESGAAPVVVLNKADLCDDLEDRRQAVELTAPGAPVVAVSCLLGQGLGALRSHLVPRRTVALLGSSGVGKSSLINSLLGEERLRTGTVRAGDDRGCHTTTHRQLVELPGGALLIDNPGLRELQLWAGDAGLGQAFDDVAALATGCRFRDCTHQDEPGCAVRQSVVDGRFDSARLDSYHALERELQSSAIRRDQAARRAAGKKAQAMYRSAKKAKASRRRW
ncbi:MAG: ribosome small subunit-dependent GTPase A [Acidobacteriota bacterium]